MRLLSPTAFALTLLTVSCSPTTKGPISFQVPAGWSVQHQSPGGHHFYTVTASTPGADLLMFSQWPPPSRPDEIPVLVQKLADGFLDRAKQSSEFALVSHQYQIEQFTG